MQTDTNELNPPWRDGNANPVNTSYLVCLVGPLWGIAQIYSVSGRSSDFLNVWEMEWSDAR